MDKQETENQLNLGFIADQSKQPASDGVSFMSHSEDKSISNIEKLHPSNHSSINSFDQEISGMEPWALDSIKVKFPKRSLPKYEEMQDYEQIQKINTGKKLVMEKMKTINISPNPYMLRSKKKVNYVQAVMEASESDSGDLRKMVEQIGKKSRNNNNEKYDL